MGLCEPILIKLDKNACSFLQSAIESREKSLMQKNPFNHKEMIKHVPVIEGNLNPSYKVLDDKVLPFKKSDSLINKKFYSVASGNEGGGEENSRSHIKNVSEEDLMKTED